jgi:tRNA pseudouridine65 synthase
MPADDLEILFHDEHLIAVNKPAGVFVHRSPMSPPSEPNVMRMLRQQIGQLVSPVHRLDRATSGVLLFALNAEAARDLSRQFSEHRVSKRYVAIVRGHTPDEATIDLPLKPHRDGLTEKSSREDDAQEAVTRLRTLDCCEIPHSAGRYPTSRYSLIEALPQTGRRHQIRRHLKHISHPIVGDVAHGDHRHNHLLKGLFGLNRMMLIASRLEFEHPVTQAVTAVEASCGPQFEVAAKFLGLALPVAVTD